jgi:hypothetical protein
MISFYNRLSSGNRAMAEHRQKIFLMYYEFIGKEIGNFRTNANVIARTYVMLTFGEGST